MTKEKWNWYLQTENDYWVNIGLQIERESCVCEIS